MTKQLLIIIILFSSRLGWSQDLYEYHQPNSLNDGWKVSHLDSVGIEQTRFHQLFNQLMTGDHQLHSMLIIKNNALVLEEYFNEYDATKPHDLRSVTKSIRSLLLGIAIDKGYIDSIDDPISKYLKSPIPRKNLDQRKDDITIKHLITMSTGLDCNDWDKRSKGQEDAVYRKKDWLQFTLDLPMINDPGTVSTYCSMGVVIMAEIVSRASGMTISEFAKKFLFDPLDINNIEWNHTSNKQVISSAKRLYMTSRDLAKIGQLILNQGQWNGHQIVSSQWIQESTSPKTKITGMDYGYLWWNIPFPAQNKTIVSKTATGNGGQYIMVFPELDLVAIFTGGAYNSQEDKLPFAIVKDVVIPSIKY